MKLSSLFIILAVAIALWQWSTIPRPRGGFFNALGLMLLLALAIEVYGGITNQLYINNNLGYNLFNFGESFLVLIIITQVRPAVRNVSIALGVIITAAFVLNVIETATVHWLAVEAILLRSFLLAGLIMYVMWWLAQTSTRPLVKLPEFWILLGMLVYFAGIVPTVGSYRYIFTDRELGSKVYRIVPALCVIRYLLAAYACRLAAGSARGMPPWRSATAL